jgi:acyl-CoA thioesterase-1
MKWIILALLLGSLCACQASATTDYRPGVALLLVGDGLSANEQIPVELSWVNLLDERLHQQGVLRSNQTIVNASTKNNTSRDASQNLPSLLQHHHPQVVVLQFALNESNQTKEQFRDQMLFMIDVSERAGAQVVLMKVKMPYVLKLTGNNIEEVYEEVAKNRQVPIVNFPLHDLFEQGLLQADRLHPSIDGQIPLMKTLDVQLRPWINPPPK